MVVPGGTICRAEGDAWLADKFKTRDGNCKFCHRGCRFDPRRKACMKCLPGHDSTGRTQTSCRNCSSNMRRDRNQMFYVCDTGTYRKCKKCVRCLKDTLMERPDHNQPVCSKYNAYRYTRSKGFVSCKYCHLWVGVWTTPGSVPDATSV